MDQEQINISICAADLVHGSQQFIVGSLDRGCGTEDLGRDEDLISGNAGGAQCLTDFRLVGIELCCIDVSVACVQCLQAGLHALVGGGAVDAEAEARDAGTRILEGEKIGDLKRGGHVGVIERILLFAKGKDVDLEFCVFRENNLLAPLCENEVILDD